MILLGDGVTRVAALLNDGAGAMLALLQDSKPVALAAAALAGALMALHLASFAFAWSGARRARRISAPPDAPPVTVVRVLCGVEPTSERTLRETLTFDYPDLRPIFCVARADDPVVPLARRTMAAFPEAGARLLIGEDRVSANPKLNNMLKAWRADTALVLFLDSNLVAPPDYVARAVAALGEEAAASAPPIGVDPLTFAADVEAAFLNAHAARWQYAAHGAGLGFAQGKTLLIARGRLPLGDLSALGREPAEDAALTRIARRARRRIALVPGPAAQSLGRRSFAEVWRRQLRWARLRRVSFPALYALELTCGALLPLVAAALAGALLGLPWLAPAFAALWWGAEIAFARACGWPVSAPALVARDLCLPLVWAAGWGGGAVTWRDATIPLGKSTRRVAAPPEAAPETA
jgi:ceramide glucosyltransferase